MRKHMLTKIFLATAGMLCVAVLLSAAALGSDKHKKRGHKGEPRHAEHGYAVPGEYKASCGDCHMVYPAFLLPEASWRQILSSANNHFGTELTLDDASKARVSDHLLANAADRNGGKLGRKIMKHTQGYAPERISTLPIFQRKHRKIAASVFNQPSVGGLHNCVACHAGAEQGDFDEHSVSIPR